MMEKGTKERMTRRQLLRKGAALGLGLAFAGPTLAACGPTPTPKVIEKVVTQVVTKKETVVVEKPVEKVVKETVIIEKPVGVQFPKKMVFMGIRQNVEDPGFDKVMKAVGQKYNIEFEIFLAPGTRVEQVAKITSMFAAGTPPDFFWVGGPQFGTYADKGILLNVETFMRASQLVKPDDFFPEYRKRVTWGGQMMCFPYDVWPGTCLFYNKDLFDEAKVGYPTRDWDWNNLMEAAIKLTKKDAQGRTTQYGYDGTVNDMRAFIWMEGGQLVNDEIEPLRATETLFDSPEAIRGMQFYVDQIHKHKVRPTLEARAEGGMTETQFFLTKRVAMVETGYGLTTDALKVKELKWGLALAPKWPKTGIRAYWTGGASWGIPNNVKSPEGSFKVLEFLFSQEGAMIWEMGRGPEYWYPILTRVDVAKEQVARRRPLVENIDTLIEGIQYIRQGIDKHPMQTEIDSKVITPVRDDILRLKLGVEEGMRKMKKEADKILQSWKPGT